MEMAASNSQFPDFSTIQMYHSLPHQSLHRLHLREAAQPLVPHAHSEGKQGTERKDGQRWLRSDS